MTNSLLKHEPLVIATVIQVQAPTSARPGNKALIGANRIIDGWVGGGCVKPAVVSAARAVLESGESCLMRVAPDGVWEAVDGVEDFSSHCLGAGSLLLYVEPLNAQPTLAVFGNTAVARYLATLAVQMDLTVTLCGNTDLSSPFPIQLHHSDELVANGADYLVIATQGQKDRAAIDAALASDCKNIEIVISKKKLIALKNQLADNGYSDEQLARLHGPAGITINAKTPNEIALSILASIVQKRRANTVQTGMDKGAMEKSGAEISGVHTENIVQIEKRSGGCCGD